MNYHASDWELIAKEDVETAKRRLERLRAHTGSVYVADLIARAHAQLAQPRKELAKARRSARVQGV